jgi:hypothetical protein
VTDGIRWRRDAVAIHGKPIQAEPISHGQQAWPGKLARTSSAVNSGALSLMQRASSTIRVTRTSRCSLRRAAWSSPDGSAAAQIDVICMLSCALESLTVE